jgi:transcriptional regulator with GAF, ATPase, and Fis domain
MRGFARGPRNWGVGMTDHGERDTDRDDRSEADAEAADLGDLHEALAGLSQLALGARPITASLERVAVLAAQAIPGADGAGLTMLESKKPDTIVMSAPFVREIDDIQYGLGEGPCITAAAQARTVISGTLGEDRAWPRFGPRAAELGVHSVVSLPLMLGDEVLGALNVYAHQRDAFTDHAAQIGEVFAVSAAVSVHNTRVLMQAQRLAGQLQTALSSRAEIDQAVGIMRSRHWISADAAFDRLRVLSQTDQVKLTVLAQNLVDEAVHRARARQAGR